MVSQPIHGSGGSSQGHGYRQDARAVYAAKSEDYARKLDETCRVLRHAAEVFPPLTQASSLGAEDVVITHLINSLHLDIPVFVLDTGALHHETLALLEATQAHSSVPVRVYRPQHEAVMRFIRDEGQEAMYRSTALRKRCCEIRKMEPLGRALQGLKAWVTGLRREQSGERADVMLVDTSQEASQGLTKFNPLADWSWGDVWHYIAEHEVNYNRLHDAFFPSIGCAPCTRAISLGEAFRAGRWWWEEASDKECGLHVKP